MKKEQNKKHKLDVKVDLNKHHTYHAVPQLSNVFFPYPPYQQQLDIVAVLSKAVQMKENALIESPTGTGKTLCLLIGSFSALVDAQGRKKVFYLTRTHSQIGQVVQEFNKINYDCRLNIVASR